MLDLLSSLTKKEKHELFDALNYLKMQEIKSFCIKHNIPTKDKKGEILERIKHYMLTGKILKLKVMPEISKAHANKAYPLKPAVFILYGAYKNDLKTRNFFKKIIGEYFHFTSFGQDWILNCWQRGKPPTYASFAKMWQKEYLRRKKTEAQPKQEWAYLNFMKKFQKLHPKATKSEIGKAWEKTREEYSSKALSILDKLKPPIIAIK